MKHQRQQTNPRFANTNKKKKFTTNPSQSSKPITSFAYTTHNTKLFKSVHNQHQQFSKLFQSTTFLSRSPSHSFHPPSPHYHSMLQNSNQNRVQRNQNTKNTFNNPSGNFNQSNALNSSQMNTVPFKNYQKNKGYKKSKNIKISSNSNKGNFQKNGHFGNGNQQYFSNGFNSDLAANNLANMLQSELTINLTKHEPRIVLFNNQNNNTYSHQQHQFNSLAHQANFQKPKHMPKKMMNNSYQMSPLSQSVGAQSAVNQRYTSRFKYVKPANVRTHAPYNTTQYIMYDYSKRRHMDQQCPNEQQQFSDDWNMTLVNGTANATESLNKLANTQTSGQLINSNASFSLNIAPLEGFSPSQVVAGSLGSSLGSNANTDMCIGNLVMDSVRDSQQLLSSSL